MLRIQINQPKLNKHDATTEQFVLCLPINRGQKLDWVECVIIICKVNAFTTHEGKERKLHGLLEWGAQMGHIRYK